MSERNKLPIRTDLAAVNEYNQNYIDSKGRGGHGLLDTGGLTDGLFNLGGKGKDLRQILDDPTTKYTPGQGYDLNWWQKNVSKLTNQDVYNAERTAEIADFRRLYGDRAELAGVNIDGTSSLAGLTEKITEVEKYKEQAPELRRQLAEVGGGYGTKALEGLGPKPSILDMQSALRKSQQSWEADPTNETSNLNIVRKANNRQITATEAQTLAATRANTLAQQTLTGQQVGQRFQEQLAADNAQNRWEDKRQNRAENALTRQMNAETNAMQMQLEYSRLAQSDRQRTADRRDQAMLALLSGLGNLGAAFTV